MLRLKKSIFHVSLLEARSENVAFILRHSYILQCNDLFLPTDEIKYSMRDSWAN